MSKALNIRDSIIYIDSTRNHHPAIVTTVFGSADGGFGTSKVQGCNLVYVSSDESKQDPYGRQIERATSVVHRSGNPAGANCWCWPDEV